LIKKVQASENIMSYEYEGIVVAEAPYLVALESENVLRREHGLPLRVHHVDLAGRVQRADEVVSADEDATAASIAHATSLLNVIKQVVRSQVQRDLNAVANDDFSRRVRDLEDQVSAITPDRGAPLIPILRTPFTVTSTPRDLALRAASGTMVSRQSRSLLDLKGIMRIQAVAEKGISPGYQHIKIGELFGGTKKVGVLTAAGSVLATNERLQDHLHSTGNDSVFAIWELSPTGDPLNVTDLFTSWSSLEAPLIIQSCDYYTKHGGSETYDQDLWWSYKAVLNSIEDVTLLALVNAKVNSHPKTDRTGPLAFFHLMKILVSCTPSQLGQIKFRLYHKLSLADFPKEDTSLHGELWTNLVKFLNCHEGTDTQDAKHNLILQYFNCSVVQFGDHFRILQAINDPRLLTLESMVATANTYRETLEADGQWHSTTRSDSAFQSRTPVPTPRVPILHTHDRAGQPIDRTPPSAGSPSSRVNANSGRTEFWCPSCLRWGSHDGAGHAPWKEQQRLRTNGRRSNSTPTPAPVPSPSPDPSPSPVPSPAPGPLTMPRSSYTVSNF
jgi:hypothetical protein